MATFGDYNLGSNPFVGISDEMILWGGKYCAVKRILIQGKIYTCGQGINTGKDILSEINRFQKAAMNDYQPISAGSFDARYARCESLEISNSNYLGAEYRAEFLAYPDEWFRETVGILEPVDNINIIEQANGLINIRRSVSARAANKEGLSKVERWIKSLNLNRSPEVSKYGFKFNQNISPKSILETYDRINGSISVEVNFTSNINSNNPTILTLSTDVQYEDRSGIYIVTVSGSLEGNTKTTLDNVKDNFSKLQFFTYAQEAIKKINKSTKLSNIPISYNITENDETDSINFVVTYNTYPKDERVNFTFTTDYDYLKDITTISISGTISFERKTQSDRETLIRSIIEQYQLDILCEDEFKKNASSNSNPLNIKNPISYSISINRGNDITADISVSYNNEDIFGNFKSSDYLSVDYDIEISPSFEIKVPAQFLDSSGGIFLFNAYRRGEYNIKGVIVSKISGLADQILEDAEKVLNQEINSIGRVEDEIILEKNIIFTENSDNGFNYDFEVKKGAIIKIT
jgi:hypothetical protein